MTSFLKKLAGFKPFTDEEAWLLFKLAAWGEAGGWTLLISGILCSKLIHNDIPVLITGQFHGILFLVYAAAAVVLSPSLGWRPRRTLIAGLCSVPPYGSLAFELWESRRRRLESSRRLHHTIFYQNLLGAYSGGLAVK